ncbi:MAG: YaiI/YqxD family protein [Planctomycetota bacterium]|jgi:uncharacterized protein YaiI (UPF0178 family)|nr:YaiI/YqxD family protein [Planctomycetota bacterium]
MNTDQQHAFTIWVDADACPRDLRDIIELAAIRRKAPTIFVANSYMHVHPSEYIAFQLVEKGGDKADDYLAEHAAPDDLAITADIPLAARLVERGVAVVSTRGEDITNANVGERLAMRNLMEELRGAGMVSSGPREMNKADVQRFANALDRFLTRKLGKR